MGETTAQRDDEGGFATNAVSDPSPHDGTKNGSQKVGRCQESVVCTDHRLINLFRYIYSE